MTPIRVLIVDDHEVVRAGLRGLVEAHADLQVVGEARDGADAAALAEALHPDVVIMDISMPGTDGAAATRRLHTTAPHTRVLVLTMHEDRAHLSLLLQAGAAGYLPKRAAAEELVRAIRHVAEGGTYVDPELAANLLRGPSENPASLVPHDAPALSEREEEVLRRIAWGETNREIASALRVSVKTVETYKARITQKLGLRARTDMVRYAVERGWLRES